MGQRRHAMEDDVAPGRCCAPARAHALPDPTILPETRITPDTGTAPEPARFNDRADPVVVPTRVPLPGGTFRMGTDCFGDDGEGPVRTVTVSPFPLDETAVTNRHFAQFIEATGYVTETEHWGWSFVFASFLPGDIRKISRRPDATPWWCAVQGADWQHPEGPGSDLTGRADHPVVQVSWADDGYRGTAPVRSFPPNGYGLYEVAGNVWEWTADWWGTEHDTAPARDPTGPATGTARVMRGGSYLCHASYCNRYRAAARTHNDPDTAGGNLGFRCAYPPRGPESPDGDHDDRPVPPARD